MFYAVFKELCDLRGVKPATAAREMGLDKSSPTKWKKENFIPSGDTLAKAADYFGVTVDYLLGQEKSPSEEGYYLDPKTAAVAEELRTNKEMGMLFDAAKDATPQELRAAHAMLLALKKKENYEDD